MSTRSYIAIEREDGHLDGIYCHSDGYLTHNGAILFDHYQDRDKVEKLISLGDMSYLQPNIDPDPAKEHSFDYEKRQDGVCVFYGRDRGETNVSARPIKAETARQSWAEYLYVFGKDGVWYYTELYEDEPEWHTVEDGLVTEYDLLGFPRPENRYGFYSQDEIERLRRQNQNGFELD